jgi:hypothetical protein
VPKRRGDVGQPLDFGSVVRRRSMEALLRIGGRFVS